MFPGNHDVHMPIFTHPITLLLGLLISDVLIAHQMGMYEIQWCPARWALRLTKPLDVDVFAIAKAIAKRCSLWGNFALR